MRYLDLSTNTHTLVEQYCKGNREAVKNLQGKQACAESTLRGSASSGWSWCHPLAPWSGDHRASMSNCSASSW